jgi:hypothetical protein
MWAEASLLHEEQAVVAIDDLITFALHGRRAMELLSAGQKFRDLGLLQGRSPVAKRFIEDGHYRTDISFALLLSKIVHSTRLGISLTPVSTGTRSDYYPHHFWLESNRPGHYTICIESFVLTYIKNVEPELETLCWRAGFLSANEEQDTREVSRRPKHKSDQ